MQILIISPIANESFMRGETIKLKAAVISNQHTTKSHLVWDSDKDGKLGSGSSLILNHLSGGLHRITVSGCSLKVSIQITIFQDLWALYQSSLSLASINSINRDFTLNWIDGSASDEKWKLYELPKFDQTLTDPSKLVLFAKLRVLKHQRFDEPLPFTSGKTIYEHLLKYSKKINLRLDCNFNSAGGGTLSLNRQFSVWDGRASADDSNPHRCKVPYPHRSLYHYTNSLYLLLHENRHNMSDDPSHTKCGGSENMDQWLEGGSGHAWAAMYLMWVYKYGSYDPPFIKNEAKTIAADLLKNRFCSKPTHSNPKVQAIINELI